MNLIKGKKITSIVEIFQKLIDGETIIINGNFYKLKDNALMYFSNKEYDFVPSSLLSFNNLIECDNVYATKILEWYDNIPKQGILCETWDLGTSHKHLRIILKKERGYFIDNKTLRWDNAVPVKIDDIKDLIYDSNN